MAYRYINKWSDHPFFVAVLVPSLVSRSRPSKMEPTRKYNHSSPAMPIAYGTFAVFHFPQSFFFFFFTSVRMLGVSRFDRFVLVFR